MPGSKRVLTDSFIERRMHDNDLTEDQLFGYREDELPHIQAGTVMLIPGVEKERVLDLLQETLRLRIELPRSVDSNLIRHCSLILARSAIAA